jgi:hypothetical protein
MAMSRMRRAMPRQALDVSCSRSFSTAQYNLPSRYSRSTRAPRFRSPRAASMAAFTLGRCRIRDASCRAAVVSFPVAFRNASAALIPVEYHSTKHRSVGDNARRRSSVLSDQSGVPPGGSVGRLEGRAMRVPGDKR